MTRQQPILLSLCLCSAALLSACGPATDAGIDTGSSPAHGQTLSPTTPSIKCNEIDGHLKVHREELAVTDEWTSLTKTAEYQKFVTTLQGLRDGHCRPYDPSPTEACVEAKKAMESAWEAVKGTDQYKQAEVTEAYQRVRKDYEEMREESCWQVEDFGR